MTDICTRCHDAYTNANQHIRECPNPPTPVEVAGWILNRDTYLDAHAEIVARELLRLQPIVAARARRYDPSTAPIPY